MLEGVEEGVFSRCRVRLLPLARAPFGEPDYVSVRIVAGFASTGAAIAPVCCSLVFMGGSPIGNRISAVPTTQCPTSCAGRGSSSSGRLLTTPAAMLRLFGKSNVLSPFTRPFDCHQSEAGHRSFLDGLPVSCPDSMLASGLQYGCLMRSKRGRGIDQTEISRQVDVKGEAVAANGGEPQRSCFSRSVVPD